MTRTLVVCKPRLPEAYVVQRRDLDAQLKQSQHCTLIYFPVFELLPNEQAIAGISNWCQNATDKPVRLLVFVSPSVLEIVLTQLGSWPANVYCGVMGQQSAKLALAMGVPEAQLIAPLGGNSDETEDSDGLAHLLGKRFGTGDCEVLVCKGPRGRVEFPEKLKDMQHSVTVLECYDRRVIEQTDLQCDMLFNRADDLVVWITSSETIAVFDEQLKQKSESRLESLRRQAILLTTHPRITAKCKELGYVHVVEIATGIQSVNSWLKSNKKSMDNNNQTSAPTPVTNASPVNPVNVGYRPDMQSGSQWLGKAAFFIAVVSFVLVLLVAFAGKNQIDKTRMAFGERIQKESTIVELAKQEIEKSGDLTKDLKTRFDLLELAQKEEASQRATLEEVYNRLLASRTEVSLSEVEQLVSVAKRQLYLLGNVSGASIALSQAVELLEGSEKPSLLNLRTAIETDLSEIKALPTDDLLKMAISLDAVVNSVESLPMLSSVQASTDQTLAEMTAEPSTEVSSESSPVETTPVTVAEQGLQKIWGTVKEVGKTVWYDIKSLIEVTQVKNPEVLMLSSRQETDLRNTLRLSLLNARISLLSRQAALLKSDLERSSSLLNTYFDTKSLSVQRAQTVIAQLNEAQLDLVLPELQATSAALRLAVAGQQGERQ